MADSNGDNGRADDHVVVAVRCPKCNGLRGVTTRQACRAETTLCRECLFGHVVPRGAYFEFWTAGFSGEEIEAMARAIWG